MKSHRFDAISFISGVVAVVFGLVFLIPQTPVDLIDAITSLGAWFWPALLVVVGIAILVPVFASRSSEEEVEVQAEDQQV
jgi:hypothetical protein